MLTAVLKMLACLLTLVSAKWIVINCGFLLHEDLDFGKLAQGFGLLHLPRMPELKGKETPNFCPVKMDFSSIPYR